MIHRLHLLVRRFVRALRYGMFFPGTTRFRPPHHARLCGREMNLSFPDELGLRSDFINVILDDEYGLNDLSSAPEQVLDLGANIGLFSIWCAHNFPRATIHAYEPNPRIVPDTTKNLAETGVTLFPCSVGRDSGHAKMVDPTESRRAQIAVREDGDIEVVGIDEAVRRIGGSVDLLKLDVEGAEWSIFENKKAFEHIQAIRMEYHLTGSRTIDDLASTVQDLGYRVDRLVAKGPVGIAWLSRQ